MINTYNISIADWDFFLRYQDNENPKIRVIENLNILSRVLTILEKNKLFYPTRMICSFRLLGDKISEENVISFRKLEIREIILMLEEILNDDERKYDYVCIKGKTYIYHEEKYFEGIIGIDFFCRENHSLSSILISTYSDLWLPSNYKTEEWQIENCIANGKRLEKSLNEIKELNVFEKIFPEKDEYGEDEIHVYGFRMYSNEDMTEEEDFPEDKIELVKPYIIKYRYDYE